MCVFRRRLTWALALRMSCSLEREANRLRWGRAELSRLTPPLASAPMAGCVASKALPDPRHSVPRLAAARMRAGSESPTRADLSNDCRPMGFEPATSGVDGRTLDRRAERVGRGRGEKQESKREERGETKREMKMFKRRGEPRPKTSALWGLEGRDRKTQLRQWAAAQMRPMGGAHSKTGTATGAGGRGPDICEELRGCFPAARNVKKLPLSGGMATGR